MILAPTTGLDRIYIFLKTVAAGIAILALLVLEFWVPGVGKSLSSVTRNEWIGLSVLYGSIVLSIAIALRFDEIDPRPNYTYGPFSERECYRFIINQVLRSIIRRYKVKLS